MRTLLAVTGLPLRDVVGRLAPDDDRAGDGCDRRRRTEPAPDAEPPDPSESEIRVDLPSGPRREPLETPDGGPAATPWRMVGAARVREAGEDGVGPRRGLDPCSGCSQKPRLAASTGCALRVDLARFEQGLRVGELCDGAPVKRARGAGEPLVGGGPRREEVLTPRSGDPARGVADVGRRRRTGVPARPIARRQGTGLSIELHGKPSEAPRPPREQPLHSACTPGRGHRRSSRAWPAPREGGVDDRVEAEEAYRPRALIGARDTERANPALNSGMHQQRCSSAYLFRPASLLVLLAKARRYPRRPATESGRPARVRVTRAC